MKLLIDKELLLLFLDLLKMELLIKKILLLLFIDLLKLATWLVDKINTGYRKLFDPTYRA